MKANFKSGSVRGVRSNSHPYRDRCAPSKNVVSVPSIAKGARKKQVFR